MPQNPARWRSSWSKMECIYDQSLILCTMKSCNDVSSRPSSGGDTAFLHGTRRQDYTMANTDSRVTIHMAASLDGFIARKDGRVDWLETSDEFAGGDTLEPGFV